MVRRTEFFFQRFNKLLPLYPLLPFWQGLHNLSLSAIIIPRKLGLLVNNLILIIELVKAFKKLGNIRTRKVWHAF